MKDILLVGTPGFRCVYEQEFNKLGYGVASTDVPESVSLSEIALIQPRVFRGLLNAPKAGKTNLLPALESRFTPAWISARGAVMGGGIGSPAILRIRRSVAVYEGDSVDLLISDFDWLIWTFGPACRIFAKGRRFDGIDLSLVTVRFSSGVIAHIEGRIMPRVKEEVRFEIAADGGFIDYRDAESWSFRIQTEGSESVESLFLQTPAERIVRAAVGFFESGDPFGCSIEDAVTAASLADAAVESMRSGQPVSIA